MKKIRDYAMIGDCQTAALVGRDGSIDWLCWPRFDSQACLAALLGTEQNGRWSIAPEGTTRRIVRRYLEDTLVLETQFETDEGAVALVDFMPPRGEASDVVRIVEGRGGRVRLRSILDMRFDYGRLRPWIQHVADGEARAIAGPHAVVLHAGAPIRAERSACVCEFAVEEGERVGFVLSYFESHRSAPKPVNCEAALRDTVAFWRDWMSECAYDGPHRETVRGSLVVMKALTYQPTGGMVAAPTTSLPERRGGERNWDYRFCWLRDATFMLLAFLHAGFSSEALAWRNWLVRAVAGEPEDVQPVYGICGEHRLFERSEPHLPGFGGAGPVRVGNAAFRQVQLDVYGEVLDALHQARKHGADDDAASWRLQRALADHLVNCWRTPDAGIWESRGEPRQFTHSKAMVWAALDRAVKAAERLGLEGDVERWRQARAEVAAAICAHGYDPEQNAFVRDFQSRSLDASLLLLPQIGFLPPDDPRMIGTVRAIEHQLMLDGFVVRYRTSELDDGLPQGEGAFLACSFWLADAYVLQGRRADAEALFEHLVGLCNDVGLMSEELDPATGDFLGNFPQALSHLSLVNTAHNLWKPHGPAHDRREGGS